MSLVKKIKLESTVKAAENTVTGCGIDSWTVNQGMRTTLFLLKNIKLVV